MKMSTTSCLFVLFALLCLLAPSMASNAQQLALAAHVRGAHPSLPRSSSGGIKEDIPDKYKERYEQWKKEFLASETGLAQWQRYEQNADFTLTITVTKDDHNGAGSGKYKWDDSGKLIAATITLGNRIDEGYPNPIYYPVMNSLAQCTLSYAVGGNILAAAKIAHEFGHVNRMVATAGPLYKLQSQLVPTYNKILLANGRNTNDPRLIELARQMGGTPVEIWEDREYWGEVNAMLYLRDRITKESEQRALFTKIIRTVELYAKSYVDRFDQVGQ
jgi:YD repeat-containing protein